MRLCSPVVVPVRQTSDAAGCRPSRGASSPRVPFVDRTFITSRSVGLCTRGVGSLSDDAALPGIHGDILYASRDSHSSSTSPSPSRGESAVLAATDADDIVVAPTGDPNEPIAPVATANDIVTASSSALSSASSSTLRKERRGSLRARPRHPARDARAPRDPPPRVRRPRRARRYAHPSAPGRDPRGRAAPRRVAAPEDQSGSHRVAAFVGG